MGAANNAGKDRNQMRPAELYEQIKKASTKASLVFWSVELHQRIAFPSACLLLGLLGPPLGSLFRQRGRMTGITIGVGIFLAYYVLLSAGRTFGENSPFFAVWTPNLLCFVLAVYLWTKMHRETPFYLALLGRPLALLQRAGSSARRHWAAAR